MKYPIKVSVIENFSLFLRPFLLRKLQSFGRVHFHMTISNAISKNGLSIH